MARENISLYIILGALSSGPKSGYDIKTRIETSFSGFGRISYGQIYPTLKRLVEQKYISIVKEDNQETRPERKAYELTDKGMGQLTGWLNESIEAINYDSKELLLKLVFGGLVAAETSIKHLRQYQEKVARQLEKFESRMSEHEKNQKRDLAEECRYIAARHGYMAYKNEMEWCQDALARLGNLKCGPK